MTLRVVARHSGPQKDSAKKRRPQKRRQGKRRPGKTTTARTTAARPRSCSASRVRSSITSRHRPAIPGASRVDERGVGKARVGDVTYRWWPTQSKKKDIKDRN